MSSFLLKKKAYAGSFAFLFQFEESAAESHRMLVEVYDDNTLSETTCRDFAGSMTTILTWVTRSVKIGPGRLRTVNADCHCRLFWTRTIPNRKKCLPSNWVFLKQQFPCGYMPWGRFKRSENGCRMNWTIGRATPKHMPNSACQTKKKVVPASDCDEKWIYFQNPKRKKFWVDPAQLSTSSSRSNRFGRKTMLFGGIRRVSSTTSC